MYICNLCNYLTKHNGNFIKHCKSKNHVNNEKKNPFCVLCKKTYVTYKSLIHHKNKYHININNNIDNNNIDNNISNIISNNNHNNENNENNANNNENSFTQKNISYKKIKNIIDISTSNIKEEITEVKNNLSDNIKSNIKEEINEVKQKIDESTKVARLAINKASSLIAYLMKYHAAAPPLKKLNKTDTIKLLRTNYGKPRSKTDFFLEKELMRQIKNETFIKKISKLILSFVDHKQINKQPIFNTDCNRNHYVIKTPTRWNEDKAGIKFSEYIISPLLKHIREMITDYRLYLEKKNLKSDIEQELYADALKVELDLVYESHLKYILNNISPHLRFFEDEIDELQSFEELHKIQENLEKIITEDYDSDSNNSDYNNYDYYYSYNNYDTNLEDSDDDFTYNVYKNYKKITKKIL